jgi:hypothetical protein
MAADIRVLSGEEMVIVRLGSRVWVPLLVLPLVLSFGCGKDERREDDRSGAWSEVEEAADSGQVGDTLETRSLPESAVSRGTELFYDDGSIDQRNSPWSEEAGGQLAVRFTPDSYPADLRGVRFFVGGHGLPMKAFRVRVYPGSASSGPAEDDLLETEILAAASYGNQWVEVDLTRYAIVITDGDFFVAMEWLTPPGNYGTGAQMLGADTSDPSGRSWWKHRPGSDWVRIEEISDTGDRDLMIRATVEAPE